jgi:methionyl-tRNA formyltransferase
MNNVNTSENIREIAGHEPDLIVVIAFGQKIGSELTNLPPKGAINVHASLLPKYRGAAPINWAIIRRNGRPVA